MDLTNNISNNSKNNNIKVLEAGYIKTTSKQKIEKRLDKIHHSLLELIQTLRPQALVLEKLYAHYRHPVTACLLGHVRGVICLLSAQENIAFFEYGSTRIKKSIVGKGHASKSQIQMMVEHMFKLKGPIQQDVADALAIAVAHINISERKL